jgi:hypothetical protein
MFSGWRDGCIIISVFLRPLLSWAGFADAMLGEVGWGVYLVNVVMLRQGARIVQIAGEDVVRW